MEMVERAQRRKFVGRRRVPMVAREIGVTARLDNFRTWMACLKIRIMNACRLVLALHLLAVGLANAQFPSLLNYQGRVTVGGTNFTGTGHFKFALVDAGTNTSQQAEAKGSTLSGVLTAVTVTKGGVGYALPPAVTVMDSTGSGATATANLTGNTVTSITVNNGGSGYSANPTIRVGAPPPNVVFRTYWNNSGSTNSVEPAVAVSLPVVQGLYSTLLGNMNLMAQIPPTVFTNDNVNLRVWFSRDGNSFAQLAPDQRLGAAGYAIRAAVADTVTALSNAYGNFTVAGTLTVGGQIISSSNIELRSGGTTGLFIGTNATVGYNTGRNIVGGGNGNYVNDGVVGATISGGGGVFNGMSSPNSVFGLFGTLGGGAANSVTGQFGVIGGGLSNQVNTDFGTIAGGCSNSISSSYYGGAVIGGGFRNSASGFGATIAGGADNRADGGWTTEFSTIGGGQSNSATGNYATVGGGQENSAGGGNSTGKWATVSGGGANTASADGATVGGGQGNSANQFGNYATVSGGQSNIADGQWTTIGGGSDNRVGGTNHSTVGGGQSNQTFGNYHTIGGGFRNTVSGQGSTAAGGSENIAGGTNWSFFVGYATVGGGQGNLAGGSNQFDGGYTTVSGGRSNSATGNYASIGGGATNTASADGATVGGGQGNSAGGSNQFGDYATVSGGQNNSATGNYASIGGGVGNVASGSGATIPGGSGNTATNDAFAAGAMAKATNVGSFVWSGWNGAQTASTNSYSFTVRALGGARFITSTGMAGVSLAPNATAWAVLSDSNAKTGVRAINPRQILAKVAELPVTSWHYKHDPGRIYIGPMAQDFHAVFGLGDDDKTITTLDTDGVTLAAIQGLVEELKERDARIAELEAKAARLDRLEADLEKIRRQIGDLPPIP